MEETLRFYITKGQKPKRDAFYDLKIKKLTDDVLDELNDQFLRRLQKEGLVLKVVFLLMAQKNRSQCRNRYAFVWRGALNYHLAGLLDTIDSLYEKYNVLIDENEYGIKYDIPHAHMFVIEGMEKVRDALKRTGNEN